MNNFMQHVADFGLSYGTIQEFAFRQNLWETVDAEITRVNAEQDGFTLGHNYLSTWTFDEKKRLNGWEPAMFPTEETELLESNGGSINWVELGAVGPVKNQGACGSCWSFSATGTLEGAHQIKTKELLSFSEQFFVSCDTTNHGCNGGA